MTQLAESPPSKWRSATISDLVGKNGLFIDGDWVESKDQDPNGEVRLIQLADVGDGAYRNKSNRFMTKTKAEELRCTFLEEGDVLIARMPDPLGRACIFPGDAKPSVTVVDVAIVRSKDGEFDHRWLASFVNAPQFRSAVAGLQAGSTRKRISRGNLATIPLPVPPLSEQQQIVSEIEKQFTRLEAGVAALRRVQTNLKRYRAAILKAACEGRLVPTEAELAKTENRKFQTGEELLASFVDAGPSKTKPRRAGRLWGAGHVPDLTDEERFILPDGWVWTKVRNLGSDPESTVQVGPMSMKSSDFTEGGVPVLNVGCVQWDRFVDTKLDHLPPDKASQFNRYQLKAGDVLFTRSGTVGRCAVAQTHQDGWIMTFHLLRARPNPQKCMPPFLRIVFEGAPHIRRQTRAASVGSTRAGFNTNLLSNLAVPLPPLAEQKRIVSEVERRLSVVEELEATVVADLKRAHRLRQSVLQKAFCPSTTLPPNNQ